MAAPRGNQPVNTDLAVTPNTRRAGQPTKVLIGCGIGCLLVVILAGALGIFALTRWLKQFNDEPERFQTALQPGGMAIRLTYRFDCHGPAWSPDGKQIAYVAGGARDFFSLLSFFTLTGGRSREQIAQTFGAAMLGHLRMMNAEGRTKRNFLSQDSPGSCDDLYWSPDGKLIYFGGLMVADEQSNVKEDIWTLDVRSDQFNRLTHDGHSTAPLLSPDGKKLLYLRQKEKKYFLCIANNQGKGTRQLAPNPTCLLAWLKTWSPDGKRIAFTKMHRVSADRRKLSLWLVNADGSGLKQVWPSSAYPIAFLDKHRLLFSAHPPSEKQASQKQEHKLMVYSRATGRSQLLMETPFSLRAPQLDRVENRLFFAAEDDLWALDLSTNKLSKLTNSHDVKDMGGISLSPDGKELLFTRKASEDCKQDSIWKLSLEKRGKSSEKS